MQKDGLSYIVNSDNVKNFRKNKRVLNLTGGVDYYYIEGYKNTISAGGGNDRILLAGNGQSDYSVVSLDAGDDAVEVNSYGCSIYGGKGNDRIILQTDLTYADGQDGDDTFNLQGTSISDLTLSGGAGNDTFNFINNSSKVTISGGSGNDVYNFDPEDDPTSNYYSERKLYKNFVTITDIGAEDTIINNYYKSDGTELSYSTNSSGDIVLEDDYGLINITLKGVKDISEVAGVTYEAYKATKTLGQLFDIDTTVKGGDNTVTNSTNYKMVYDSSSVDSIYNTGDYVTICGGSGSDTITNSGSNIVYQFNPSTDGDDVIYGFNSTDTIQVPNTVKSYSWKNVGSDRVITISGQSITLKNAASISKVNVYTGYSASSSRNYFEERNFVEDHWFTQEEDGFKNEIDSMMNSSNEKASITIKDDLTSVVNPLQSKLNQMTITHSDLNKK